MKSINEICEKWFSELPAIYSLFYDSLFENNKYRIKGKFEYVNTYFSDGRCGPWFSTIIGEYDFKDFMIVHNPVCSESFRDLDKENGLLCIHSGFGTERFLQRKRLFYDSVRCLLYQGICKELGFETRGLNFDGMNYRLF